MKTGLGSLLNESVERASLVRTARAWEYHRWVYLTALCGCLGVGCTQLDDATDSCLVLGGPCETDQDGSDGPEVPPAWSCLNETPQAPPANASRPPITYVVPIVDFANPPTRPAALAITVCQFNDSDCENPVPAAINPVPNQPPAVVAITVPYGFDGYLKMTATDYVDTEYYLGGPMLGNLDGTTTVQGIPIPMLRQSVMDGMFTDLIQTRDITAGVLAIRSINCLGVPADNVDVKMDDPVRGFGYTLINNQPVASDPPLPTDTRGVAGYANVPPGGTSVRGFVGDSVIGRTGFRVRENQLTVGEVRSDAGLYGR